MQKTFVIVVTLLSLSFFSIVIAGAQLPIPMENTETTDDAVWVEWGEIDGQLFISQMEFGPGSETPWYDPIVVSGDDAAGGIWLSNSEPESVSWKFYDPNWHHIYTESHEPSLKERGPFNVDGKVYEWAYADYTTFTIPGFAPVGNWYGTVTWQLADGTMHSGAYTYYVPVNDPGSVWTNIFGAPLYFFGFKLPPLFWILGIIWIPGLFLLILIVWARGVEGMVKVINAARSASRRARAEWKKTKGKKEKAS